MEHFRLYGWILTLVVLSSAVCRAEDSICTHRIQTMIENGTLVLESANKVGKTNLVTYTCHDDAVFGSYAIGASALMLPNKNDSVVTSRITNLKQVKISYVSDEVSTPDYLQSTKSMYIKVSQDSVVWTNLTSRATHSAGIATVQLENPGDYYISVKNIKNDKPIYIRIFEYTIQRCNCYQYHP